MAQKKKAVLAEHVLVIKREGSELKAYFFPAKDYEDGIRQILGESFDDEDSDSGVYVVEMDGIKRWRRGDWIPRKDAVDFNELL